MMENGLGEVMEESEVDSRSKAHEQTANGRRRWLNGNGRLFLYPLVPEKALHAVLSTRT